MVLALLKLFCLCIGLLSRIVKGYGDLLPKACYAALCDDVISGCDNFPNNVLNCDGLQFQPANGTDGEEAMSLNGYIDILATLDEGVTMVLEVTKETEVGDEPVSSFALDICESLQNEDAPWSDVVKEMKMTSCPIEVGKYYLSNLVLSLGGMELTQNMCGDYQAKISMIKEAEELSCHIMSLVVHEVSCK
ncbi:hypothetical protein K1T71_008893 [Dendrolimus kikuchii]|uniref:Uncharacterized protein n=1 Tax=Dendrolimus kikuchii TaxID=765133 RepID=A0ACC1CW71_9NEOP|nr:hypothetical protein K1T71_008893 [Dendrolimus kikuchii]